MGLFISEMLHTLGFAVAAFALLTLLAVFLKAESATWTRRQDDEAP